MRRRVGFICVLAAAVVATAAAAPAQEQSGGEGDQTETESTPTPTPTPSPGRFSYGGYVRSFYFTRQNASNDPGAQFDYAPGAKYDSNAVNQASWNTGIALHGNYDFPGAVWNIGATYFYANPLDGQCVVAASHATGAVCVTQIPPNTNADDTLPGFTLSTLDEAYLAYDAYGFSGSLGSQLFNSPWANPSDSRLKPAAFQGGSLTYSGLRRWTFETAKMLSFENRTSSDFTRQTLLTSYPAGGKGLPENINAQGGQGITTNGFTFLKVGFDDQPSGFSASASFYGISDLANMWWFAAKYRLPASRFSPFVALQSGIEDNAGSSYLGKIDSQAIGVQLGANVSGNVALTAGYDAIPWRIDTTYLPKDVTCNSGFQIGANGTTLAYFLPLNAAQCAGERNRETQIYYGGWASPYTDSYSTDPLFTTSVTQGMADRRAPGSSWKIALSITTNDKRCVFLATEGWYDYGNALAPQSTNIWTLDGRYYFSPVGKETYRGFFVRYRYAQRTQTNTTTLGGLPLFKYNRAQLEYDF